MNSFFGYIVGLLQAALSLIGFVQVHPDLPQAQKDQAQQVAQQAVTISAKAMADKVNASVAVSESSKFNVTPTSGPAPLTVHLTATFDTSVTGDVRGNYVDFGDSSVVDTAPTCQAGTTLCSRNLSHTYQTPGTYIVKLMNNNRQKIDDGTIQGKIIGSVITIAETKVTVTSSNQTSISVPGMQQYTDADFGFSFWYPSGWAIGTDPNAASIARSTLSNTSAVSNLKKIINRLNAGPADAGLNMWVIDAPSSSFTLIGTNLHDNNRYTFVYDSSHNQWTVTSDNTSPGYNYAPSLNTTQKAMGGESLVTGFYIIVPVSSTRFLVMPNGPQGPNNSVALAKTVVTTNLTAVTPVSEAEQIKIIEAEKNTYATQ